MTKRWRVLVAEDEPTNREVATSILTSLGYEVFSVGNGQEAVELLEASGHGFDVVLMDVLMPVLDGFAAIRRLREAPASRSLAIICVSAMTGEINERSGQEAGCDYYLSKPYRARQLAAAMTHVLQARGLLAVEGSAG